MKLFLTIVSVIACLNLTLLRAHPQTGNRPVDVGGSLISSVPISLTGETPPEIESPEFPRLLFKCISEGDWTMIDSCEKETELKLSMTKPTAVKSDASKGDKEKFEEDEKKYSTFACECLLKKMGAVDEMTNQLDMTRYGAYYETTSLSSEQKALASADFISCMSTNLVTPSLPVFVRWNESSNEVIGNMVSAKHVIGCDLHSLIKNGCSDTSVNNSTLTWIMQDIQARLTKELLH